MASARFAPKRVAGLGLAVLLSSALAGCQYQSAEDLLFKPTATYYSIPQTYGTQYDCRSFEGPGWKGRVAGKYTSFDMTGNVSRVGCFKTLPECKAFLTYIGGFIQIGIYSRCEDVGA